MRGSAGAPSTPSSHDKPADDEKSPYRQSEVGEREGVAVFLVLVLARRDEVGGHVERMLAELRASFTLGRDDAGRSEIIRRAQGIIAEPAPTCRAPCRIVGE